MLSWATNGNHGAEFLSRSLVEIMSKHLVAQIALELIIEWIPQIGKVSFRQLIRLLVIFLTFLNNFLLLNLKLICARILVLIFLLASLGHRFISCRRCDTVEQI